MNKELFRYSSKQMSSLVKLTPSLKIKVKCGMGFFVVSRQSILIKCTYNPALVYMGNVAEGIAFITDTVYDDTESYNPPVENHRL